MVGGSGDVSMWEVGRWVLPVITARFSLSPMVDVEAKTLPLPHTCKREREAVRSGTHQYHVIRGFYMK